MPFPRPYTSVLYIKSLYGGFWLKSKNIKLGEKRNIIGGEMSPPADEKPKHIQVQKYDSSDSELLCSSGFSLSFRLPQLELLQLG